MEIFVSYTLRDGVVTLEKLEKLKTRLSKNNYCFIDILDNDSEDKQKRVYDELRRANQLLVIKSPSINKSVWANKEYEYARTKGIPIMDIDIDKVLENEEE